MSDPVANPVSLPAPARAAPAHPTPEAVREARVMEKAMDDSIVIEGHPWAKGSYAAFVLAALFHDRPDPKAWPSLNLEVAASDYAPSASGAVLPPAQPALRLDQAEASQASADAAVASIATPSLADSRLPGAPDPASVPAPSDRPSPEGDTATTAPAGEARSEESSRATQVHAEIPVEEGFSIALRRSTLDKMPPVPTLSLQGAATLAPDVASMASASTVTVAATSDPDVHEAAARLRAAALEGWSSLAAADGRPAPKPALATAAFMTLWRVARETGLVRGGFLFHALHDPTREQAAEGEDVRLVWERTGPHVDKALLQSEDGGAFSLLR